MRSVLLAFLALGSIGASGADGDLLLDRVRTRITQMLARVPKYACALAVTREYYEPTFTRLPRSCAELASWKQGHTYGLSHYSTNRLKLDVAMADGREIFSWAGAGKFEERDLADMLSEGPTGTGSFAGFLSNIFDGKSAKITYRGGDVNSPSTSWFDYSVPLAHSNHRFQTRKEWVLVAYDGSFQVDNVTGDLLHLTVRVGNPPAASRNCETTADLVYTRGGNLLLPTDIRQHFVNNAGSEAHNTARYSACREFQTESKVSFARPPAGPRSRASGATLPVPAPTNRPVTLELARAIDTTTASAGDFFTGRLVQPIRDIRGRELVPAGALIQGHLTRVQRYHLLSQTTVVFQPEFVAGDDGPIPIALLPRSHKEYIWATTWSNDKPVRWRSASTGEVPYRNEHNLGVYHFAGTDVAIPIGFRTEWITGKP
jgi:hypothetical protein